MVTPAPLDPPSVEPVLWGGLSGVVGYDIGGNVGQSLRQCSDRFEQTFTFEPAEECWLQLQNEAARFGGHPHVQVVPKAVSDIDGYIPLAVAPGKIETGQLIADNLVWEEWGQETAMRYVPCVTVDKFARQYGPPDVMKIDVEGGELRVLLGARETLKADHPDLLVEIHSTNLGIECKALLESLGYDVGIIRHPHYAPDHQYYDWHYWIRATEAL